MSNRRGDRNSTPSEQTLPKQQAMPGGAGQAHHQDEGGEGEGADLKREDMPLIKSDNETSLFSKQVKIVPAAIGGLGALTTTYFLKVLFLDQYKRFYSPSLFGKER